MSEENIENVTKPDSNFAPTFVDHHVLPDINFNGHCLINNIYIPKKVINIYSSYTLNSWLKNSSTSSALSNCLFGSVKLTKNNGPVKYKYSSYDIGCDSRSDFLFTAGSMGKNVIIFGAHMSSSLHIDNKNKNILIFGEGATQRLDNTVLTTEAIYPINFKQTSKRFELSYIMFKLIKIIFFGLVTGIVSASNHTKCFSLSNQKYMSQSTLINLHSDEYIQEFYCYPFAVKLDRLILTLWMIYLIKYLFQIKKKI